MLPQDLAVVHKTNSIYLTRYVTPASGSEPVANTALCLINIHSPLFLTKRTPTLFGSENVPS